MTTITKYDYWGIEKEEEYNQIPDHVAEEIRRELAEIEAMTDEEILDAYQVDYRFEAYEGILESGHDRYCEDAHYTEYWQQHGDDIMDYKDYLDELMERGIIKYRPEEYKEMELTEKIDNVKKRQEVADMQWAYENELKDLYSEYKLDANDEKALLEAQYDNLQRMYHATQDILQSYRFPNSKTLRFKDFKNNKAI